MHVACPNCGGTASIANDAIREGLAKCSYCDAFIVVASSEHPLQKRIELEKKKLKIKRKGNHLSVTGRRPWGGGGRADKREVVIGSILGLVSLPFLGGDLVASLIFAGFIALFGMIAASWFRLYSPPLTLDKEWLHSGLLGAGSFMVEDIRQLFSVTAVYRGGNPGQSGSVHHNLCILTRSGHRETIFGPAKNIEIVLAIEQLLEDELGLYNLRVKGDAQAPASSVEVMRESGSMTCGICRASITPTSEDWQRGFLNCPYCEHLTGLYREGGEGVVLGESELKVALETTEDGSLVLDAPVPIRIDPSRRELHQGDGETAEVLSFEALRGVAVRHVGGLKLASGGGMVSRMKQAQARSGEISVGEVFAAAFLNIEEDTYSVVLLMKEGLDRVLVSNLSDGRDALNIKTKVEALLAQPSSPAQR